MPGRRRAIYHPRAQSKICLGRIRESWVRNVHRLPGRAPLGWSRTLWSPIEERLSRPRRGAPIEPYVRPRAWPRTPIRAAIRRQRCLRSSAGAKRRSARHPGMHWIARERNRRFLLASDVLCCAAEVAILADGGCVNFELSTAPNIRRLASTGTYRNLPGLVGPLLRP